ncbi:RNase H family protein [Actinomadura sp. WMMB 499]|uniref:RNase H family protein n=1 Tax=Actinomadura sp. WMMB 499 TaxID=1219491 RepID=UPI00159DAA50|nr:RNase H family protein [Actinomadura sp. WMMB 499]
MPMKEFDDARARMPPRLAARTQPMRACATRSLGCPCCGAARRLLWLCFAAVRHGDTGNAEMLAGEAEHHLGTGPHSPGCPQVAPPSAPYRWPPVRGRVPVRRGRAGPLVAATDASVRDARAYGIGYVVDTGRWGMRARPFRHQDPTGPGTVLVGELRAVNLLVDDVGDAPDLLVLVDSLSALHYLRAWQRGDTSRFPAGYDLRPRRARPPTLVRLAERVAHRPGLRTEHVKGHSGHPLNETADSLASIARRGLARPLDPTARAESLVTAFLRAWHDGHGLAA